MTGSFSSLKVNVVLEAPSKVTSGRVTEPEQPRNAIESITC